MTPALVSTPPPEKKAPVDPHMVDGSVSMPVFSSKRERVFTCKRKVCVGYKFFGRPQPQRRRL